MLVRIWSYCSPRDQLLLEQRAIALLLGARVLELARVAVEVGLGLLHVGLALDERGLGLAELRDVAGDVGLRLAQRDLERPRVDDEEHVAGLDVGAVGRRLPLDEALDARADLDGLDRLGLAHVVAVHGDARCAAATTVTAGGFGSALTSGERLHAVRARRSSDRAAPAVRTRELIGL